jgi:preprotein translocase SecE subunit
VARPTRQARRERREQQRADRERDSNGAAVNAARRPQPVTAGASVPESDAQPAAVKHRGGVIGFIGECIAELKKVEWPGQKQVLTGTVVVIVACTIVGMYLWGIDQLVRPLIERLI